MSGALQIVDGGGPPRCSSCGAEAAGPCMRCHRLLCGDCCVLTEGGVQVYAICRRCASRGGRSLRPGWWSVAGLLGLVLLVLLGVNILITFLARP